ncbi:MAG TPA: aminotransferase class V-fold PLP-dependent enzyme, partial [Micromonosporaceae bacterium]
MDAADDLASFRDQFARPDEDLIYLDGNSLGRMPLATLDRVTEAMRNEWSDRLIRSWNEHWFDLPERVGEQLASGFLGAAPGQVVLADSTTVNFFKLAAAAITAAPDGRRTIITDRNNFPTDRYVLEGLASTYHLDLKLVDFDEVDGPTADAIAPLVGDDTALVTLSHVDYRSGALADMAAINEVTHRAGGRVLWDLSHSVGAVPVELDATDTDLAVGCTYKYLNGGPGAPAFLYVRGDLQDVLRTPIWGWYGQNNQFAMGQGFDPVPGVGAFLSGTPAVLAGIAASAGISVMAEAGIGALRAKGQGLTDFAIRLADEWLADLGFSVASPRDSERRGSHVSLRHPEGYRVVRA